MKHDDIDLREVLIEDMMKICLPHICTIVEFTEQKGPCRPFPVDKNGSGDHLPKPLLEALKAMCSEVLFRMARITEDSIRLHT